MKVEEAIKNRRTLKVLATEFAEVKDISKDVSKILEMGHSAPFHYINSKAQEKELTSLAPWRFYVLDGDACRKLASYFEENEIAGGKIIDMLKAAQTLIQVTWTPETVENDLLVSEATNIEHIAATSAAIQNMLLAATSLGYENYWSSGGMLKEEQLFTKLGISLDEKLLGSIFLFDADTSAFKTKKGALRGRQGPIEKCAKRIKL